MIAEQVIDILQEVNEHFLLKTTTFIPSMLESVAPYVNAAGADAHSSYIAAKQRLRFSMQPLIDPRTGMQIE